MVKSDPVTMELFLLCQMILISFGSAQPLENNIKVLYQKYIKCFFQLGFSISCI